MRSARTSSRASRTPRRPADLAPPTLFIAIPTFRRVRLLRELLLGIAEQRVALDPADVRVLVLDNDAGRSAQAVVEALRAGFPFRLEYACVPEPGLAAIRNRALDLARGRCDYLAMIDDDERPEPQWLAELLWIRRSTGAEAVVGPVPATLPVGAPRWMRDFRSREVPTFADGAFLCDGWSGNCLLDVRAIARLGLAFDRSLDFAGGEDQLFFRQLVARGARIAYAARAVAWEAYPVERQSLGFALRRCFRRGNSLALCDRRLHGVLRATVPRLAKAIATIGRAVGKAWLAARRRDACVAIDGACDGMTGLGMAYGALGMTYQAYRRKPEARVASC